MKIAITIAIISVVAFLGLTFIAGDEGTPRNAPNAGQRLPRLACEFLMQWRLGAPSFAYEQFPRFEQREPVIFAGKMAPRGSLILRPRVNPGGAAPIQCVLRSKTVDITQYLKIEGAYYRKIGDSEETLIVLDKLPQIKVQYEPLIPEEIVVPGEQNCVLLFEIGEGKEGEWAEGHWRVYISFDFSKLDVDIINTFGGEVVEMKSDLGGVKAVFSFEFIAKALKTDADEHNMLYYQYQDCWSSGDQKTRAKATEPLGKLIEAYPTEANFIYERAKLLAEQGRYAEAVKDVEMIEEILRKGTPLRSSFMPFPDCATGEGPLSPEEIMADLERIRRGWTSQAAKQSESPDAAPLPESQTSQAAPAPAGETRTETGFPWYIPVIIVLVLGTAAFVIVRMRKK